MDLNVKIFYTSTRYLPHLEHPKFGKFPYDENESCFIVPRPYAEELVKVSPGMFALERSNIEHYAQMSSGKGGFAKITKYAKGRGVDVKGLKKEEIIEALLKLDKESE